MTIAPNASAGRSVDQYNVVWYQPGAGPRDSMPLGNGDIGINVWVEQDGDLLFYLSKTDAWSETCRLLKLGQVRVRLTSNPFHAGLPFRQMLQLSEGEMVVQAGAEGSGVELRLWVDANAPLARLEVESQQPVKLEVMLESWRTRPRALTGQEQHSAYGLHDGPETIIVDPDDMIVDEEARLIHYHHNARSIWADNLRYQGLGSFAEQNPQADPLLHRTFGVWIEGHSMKRSSPNALASSQPGVRYVLRLGCHTSQGTPEELIQELRGIVEADRARDLEEARTAHRDWWTAFWDRSWIFVEGSEAARQVTQGYILHRYLQACAGRGAFPLKFNGSIFNVDRPETIHGKAETFDADYRRWGGAYWYQNTRLPYHAMLAAGDFDMMMPLFRMYRDCLPLALNRTPIYFGHGGAFFPETMYFWGTYANENWGWDRSGLDANEAANRYIGRLWSGALELCSLMLDAWAYARQSGFLQDTLLPLATAVLTFYDQHYPRDGAGKLTIRPAQSLETYQEVVNPAPDIAGLRSVLLRLLSLPEQEISSQQRDFWRRLLEEAPELPASMADGQAILSPAQDVLEEARNSENPELYAVWPFRIFGVGLPDLELARRSFSARRVKGTGGWRQDGIQAACLGITEEAKQAVVDNFQGTDPMMRFPAFWGPNFDWVPDLDNGSVAMIALQSMLLQPLGEKILLLPAWPADWDVSFKLHAPGGVIVQGRAAQGRLVDLQVYPPEKKKDVRTI